MSAQPETRRAGARVSDLHSLVALKALGSESQVLSGKRGGEDSTHVLGGPDGSEGRVVSIALNVQGGRPSALQVASYLE